MSDNTEALSELELLWQEINHTEPDNIADHPSWERLVQAHKAVVRALESPSVPEGCGWCGNPPPLNEEGLCHKCLYPDGPPVGWKLVPVEPTEDMIEAIALNRYERVRELAANPQRHVQGAFMDAILEDYRTWLASAPEPGD